MRRLYRYATCVCFMFLILFFYYYYLVCLCAFFSSLLISPTFVGHAGIYAYYIACGSRLARAPCRTNTKGVGFVCIFLRTAAIPFLYPSHPTDTFVVGIRIYTDIGTVYIYNILYVHIKVRALIIIIINVSATKKK